MLKRASPVENKNDLELDFKVFKMTSKMAEIAGCGLWNRMGFVMIQCTEKITDLFFRNGNVFCVRVFVLVIVSINPCTTFKTTFDWI